MTTLKRRKRGTCASSRIRQSLSLLCLTTSSYAFINTSLNQRNTHHNHANEPTSASSPLSPPSPSPSSTSTPIEIGRTRANSETLIRSYASRRSSTAFGSYQYANSTGIASGSSTSTSTSLSVSLSSPSNLKVKEQRSKIKDMPVRVVGAPLRSKAALKRLAQANTARHVSNSSANVNTEVGAWYQREEMLQHEILTKDAEYELGNAIIKAKKLREEMTDIIESMRLMEDENNLEEHFWDGHENCSVEDGDGHDDDDDDCDNNGMYMNGSAQHFNRHLPYMSEDGMQMEHMSVYENLSAESKGFDSLESWQNSLENHNFQGDQRISSTLVRDGSRLSRSALEADLQLLTEDDVVTKMKIEGGKRELREIFQVGSESRTMLMKSNIRLVVSIAKKWMGSSYAAGGNIGSRTTMLYNGGWDRPSLDEVIQEGVLGLARAVDKFDPGRGLRFSTYSTHWITSYVRQAFQSASTGCLKVPAQLHEIKNSYQSLVKRYVESSERLPSEEELAAELGVTLNRLRVSIRATESLLSIDEPVYNSGNAAYKGSGAGGDNSGGSNLLMLDRLQCTEIPPEDFVEISFLRQTLENAMAAELSPYERDIVRMRLGLDDGQTRTVRQVVEECGGGISVSDVRSAERRAFKKLRSPNALHAHNLMEFLEMIGADVDVSR